MKGFEEAIKQATVRAKHRFVRCQGKGGMCPQAATQRTDRVPGAYCDICTLEVDRVLQHMKDYVLEHNLINQDSVVEKLRSIGLVVNEVKK
jgi:hypothetical protein